MICMPASAIKLMRKEVRYNYFLVMETIKLLIRVMTARNLLLESIKLPTETNQLMRMFI